MNKSKKRSLINYVVGKAIGGGNLATYEKKHGPIKPITKK